MRVGINLLAIRPERSGGVDVYTRNLVRALGERGGGTEYVLYVAPDNRDVFAPYAEASGMQLSAANISHTGRFERVLWEQLWLPRVALRDGIHVLHSPTYTWPIASRIPGVVTVPDLLYIKWPESIDPAKRLFWRIAVPASIRSCRQVLAISETARKDLLETFGLPPDRVIASPLAAPPDAIQARRMRVTCEPGSEPYFLSLGAYAKHKDAATIIDAFHQARGRGTLTGHFLMLAGWDQGVRGELVKRVSDLGMRESVMFMGPLVRQEMLRLLCGAKAYVTASRMEGFGLPVVEAMATETPVICSLAGALPEVVGDAALTFPVGAADVLADRMIEVAHSPGVADRLRARGLHRVEQFSWEMTATATHRAYEAACGQ